MDWHNTHNVVSSDDCPYEWVCSDCAATDDDEYEYLRRVPCGMPDLEQFSKQIKLPGNLIVEAAILRRVFDKKTLHMLAYNGFKHSSKWLEFGALIGQISYKPGWYLRADIEEDRMWFQIGVTEEAEISFDPIVDKKIPWLGEKHYLSPHMCRNEIVSEVKLAIDQAEMRAINKWFDYQNVSIFNTNLGPC